MIGVKGLFVLNDWLQAIIKNSILLSNVTEIPLPMILTNELNLLHHHSRYLSDKHARKKRSHTSKRTENPCQHSINLDSCYTLYSISTCPVPPIFQTGDKSFPETVSFPGLHIKSTWRGYNISVSTVHPRKSKLDSMILCSMESISSCLRQNNKGKKTLGLIFKNIFHFPTIKLICSL